MKRRLDRSMSVLSIATLCVALLAPNGVTVSAQAIKKVDLKVLYVGGSGEKDYVLDKSMTGYQAGRRTASFQTLLERYFTHVTVMDAKDYRQEKSADFDVTVMDGTPPAIDTARAIKDSAGRTTAYLAARYFTEDFDRPVIFVAETGDKLGRRIGAKIDWY
jgi:hypothetical protein